MENGVEADNPSVIKNWRHTMGPAQMSAAHDDGVHTYFHTHSDLLVHVQAASLMQGVSVSSHRKLQSASSSEGESLFNN